MTRSLADSDFSARQHYFNIVNSFMAVDAANGGAAAQLWPKILKLAYPVFRAFDVTRMLAQLIMRGLTNQRRSDCQDFTEVFAGAAQLTYQLLNGSFEGHIVWKFQKSKCVRCNNWFGDDLSNCSLSLCHQSYSIDEHWPGRIGFRLGLRAWWAQCSLEQRCPADSG